MARVLGGLDVPGYHVGECRGLMRQMPEGCVQTIVTSPPYWGLRDYDLPPSAWGDGWNGCLGLEPTPEMYVAHLTEVFAEARRVLRDDGTLWLNLGDSYCSTAPGTRNAPMPKGNPEAPDQWATLRPPTPAGMKPKDLVGIPWMAAFALRSAGWWLRSEIIWEKPSCMPEAVHDRPTRSHEQVFLLTKSREYFYDIDAIREPITTAPQRRFVSEHHDELPEHRQHMMSSRYDGIPPGNPAGRNKRTVWSINPEQCREAHFAVMPSDLVKPCVLAGTSERGACAACGSPWERLTEKAPPAPEPEHRNPGKRLEAGQAGNVGAGNMGFRASKLSGKEMNDWKAAHPDRTVGWGPTCACGPSAGEPLPCVVLDPFMGSGTVGRVAQDLGRDWIGLDLSPQYAGIAAKRTAQASLLAWRPTDGGAKEPAANG